MSRIDTEGPAERSKCPAGGTFQMKELATLLLRHFEACDRAGLVQRGKDDGKRRPEPLFLARKLGGKRRTDDRRNRIIRR